MNNKFTILLKKKGSSVLLDNNLLLEDTRSDYPACYKFIIKYCGLINLENYTVEVVNG